MLDTSRPVWYRLAPSESAKVVGELRVPATKRGRSRVKQRLNVLGPKHGTWRPVHRRCLMPDHGYTASWVPGALVLRAAFARAGDGTTGSDIFDQELLVAPRFCDHLRKRSLAQPGLKRLLRIPEQIYHRLFMRAACSARPFLWILVNRKNGGRTYCFVNFQQTDLMCWPRQRRKTIAAARCHY